VEAIIRQRNWTEAELREAGFHYYARQKQVVMARVLPADEAPLRIRLSEQERVAIPAGYMICYQAGQKTRRGLREYEHWPCRADIFVDSYRAWDEPHWKPTPAEADLIARGCEPYYKFQGVWAKRVTQPTSVQSIESEGPVIIPIGNWLAIGDLGAPYYMDDASFQARYSLS
jgi:hypothetical protein